MFGEKAIELIKELDRCSGTLTPYNNDLVSEVQNEIKHLVECNKDDASLDESGATGTLSGTLIPTIKCRHSAIRRDIRCLLAYHYNRLRCLRKMKWEFGGLLPSDIKENMSHLEVEWISKYSSNLGKYMRSVGDEGINLTLNLKPPKSLYVEVRCLSDYGRLELNNGHILLLKKNTRHFLPRSEAEELIRQGVLEHIVN
ncbi:DNA replication complex GINS protein PSF1-like [Harmonia axyridis]|uniref:DNA replication complex GINS protein PSF1-like n=1 Tax=Harmonia axyridis TaxID=115357 RepID=UPI001E2772BD|nr:DNA replication complex GINS protein PSF1-like [Harmonia axyridis]